MSNKARSPIPEGEAYVTYPTHESTVSESSPSSGSAPLVAAPKLTPRTRGAGQESGKPNPGGRIRNLFRQSSAARSGVSFKSFVATVLTAIADSVVYGVQASREAIKAAVAWKTAKAKKPVKTKHPKRAKKAKAKVQPKKEDTKSDKRGRGAVATAATPAPATPAAA